MEKLILTIFLICSSTLGFSKETSLEIVGTFNNVTLKNGKFIKTPSFERLPEKWEKNDQFYNFILLHDPKNEVNNKNLSVVIETVKDKQVVKSIVLPEKNFKKVGNKYYINSFKDVYPSIYGAPYSIRYIVKAGEITLTREIKILEAD